MRLMGFLRSKGIGQILRLVCISDMWSSEQWRKAFLHMAIDRLSYFESRKVNPRSFEQKLDHSLTQRLRGLRLTCHQPTQGDLAWLHQRGQMCHLWWCNYCTRWWASWLSQLSWSHQGGLMRCLDPGISCIIDLYMRLRELIGSMRLRILLLTSIPYPIDELICSAD